MPYVHLSVRHWLDPRAELQKLHEVTGAFFVEVAVAMMMGKDWVLWGRWASQILTDSESMCGCEVPRSHLGNSLRPLMRSAFFLTTSSIDFSWRFEGFFIRFAFFFLFYLFFFYHSGNINIYFSFYALLYFSSWPSTFTFWLPRLKSWQQVVNRI